MGSTSWTQCPAITDSDLDQTDLNFCLGDVLIFTVEGTDLPAGDVIDFYISQTMDFNPYNSQGTSIGTTPITQMQCATQPEILYLMVNPDNTQVGSDDDRCDEFIIIYTGSGGYTPNNIEVANLAGGAMWDNFIPGNTASFNCGTALNPGDPVPPNSILVIQSNFMNNVTIDLGALCTSGLSVYIIAFNMPPSCNGGYLDNSNSNGCTSCPVILNITGMCIYGTQMDYTPPASNVNGWGVSNLGGGGVYANVVPAVSIPPFISPDAFVSPFVWNIPPDFCTIFGSGTYFITGILNPAPTGGCPEIFTNEFQIHISCPSATLSGDVSVCSSNCPADPGQVLFDFSGGIEPYTVDVLVTATGFPPFSIPGVAFTGSGQINICIDGFLPSYDPGTQTLTIPEFLIGEQLTITLQSIVDNEGCVGVVMPPGTLVITLYDSPIANAGNNITSCVGTQLQLNGSIGGSALAFEWITSGDGQIGDPTSLQSIYIPGANDIVNGSVTITLVAFEPSGGCEPDSSMIEITILEEPQADAGIDQTLCSDDLAQLAGSIAGAASSATWSTSGNGAFSNNIDLNATYDPGSSDILNGVVWIYLTTDDVGGQCDAAVDSLLLTLISPPVISGPPMGSVCQGDLAFISAIVTGDVGSLMWTTSGDGTFEDPMSEATFYTQGNQDTTNGFVILTLTVTDVLGICDPVVYTLTLTIFDCGCPPITLQDPPNALCSFEGELDLSTLVLIADPGSWQITTAPPGSDPAELVGDLFDAHNADAGSYTVTFTIDFPLPGCPASASIDIEVIEAPKFTAGFDLIVCASQPVVLNGAATGSAGPVIWSSTGAGVFSNPATLITSYTPDSSDIAAGSVMLIVSGTDTVGVCPVVHDTAVITLVTASLSALIIDAAVVCNDSTLGSVIDLFSFVEGGDTTGTWISLSGVPIDISDPGNVDFNLVPPSSYLFQYTSAPNPPCSSIIDTVTIQVLTCICPQLIVNPLPAAVCNSSSGVNLDAFVMASQPGGWTLISTPPGAMPAILIGSFLNTISADAGVYEAMFSFQNHIDACPDSAILEIIVQQALNVSAGNDTIICNTDVLQVAGTVNSSVSFLQWFSSGDGMFGDSSMAITSYVPGPQDIINGNVQLTLMGNDTTGICPTSQISFVLTIQQAPFAIFDTSFVSVCNIQDSGSVVNFVSLITGGDASGNWLDVDASGVDLSDLSQVDFDGVVPGIYQFQYTTMSALPPCVEALYFISIEVNDCLCPDLSLSNPSSFICNNDTVDLGALLTTPQIGVWQLDNINGLPSPPIVFGNFLHVSGSTPGSYRIEFNLTDPIAGCLSIAEFLFDLEAVPLFSIGEISCRPVDSLYDVTLITNAETVVSDFGIVTAGTGDTIWISDIPDKQDIALSLTSLSGCTVTAVVVAPECSCDIMITNVPDTISFCSNDTIQFIAEVSGSGIQNAYWLAPGDTIFGQGIEVIAGGIYEFFVASSNGCTVRAELLAVEFPSLVPDIQFFDPLCPGGTEGSIFIQDVSGATLPLMYSVNGGTFEVIDTTIWAITTLGAGDYFVVIEDANGCQASAAITLDDALGETLDLGPDISIASGDSVFINPVISFIPDMFTYSPALLDSLRGWIVPNQNLVLMLDAIDSRGCLYTDEIVITVSQREGIFAPNIFTPNGDQVNDTWTIYTEDFNAHIVTISIYDRWGGLLYSRSDIPTNDPSLGWDGRSNEKEVGPGVYVFMAIIQLSGGDELRMGGDITVVK